MNKINFVKILFVNNHKIKNFGFILLLYLLVTVLSINFVSASSYIWNSDLTSWSKRVNITISNNYSINMVNTPIRINIMKFVENTTYDDFGPNGSDIRFTDNNGINLSSFVELWQENENISIAWVNVTIPSASNVTIFLYYGNNNATAKNVYDDFMMYENFTSGTTPANWSLLSNGPGSASLSDPLGIDTFGTDTSGNPPKQSYSAHIECTGTGGNGCDALRFKPFVPQNFSKATWSFNMNYTVDFYYYVNSSAGIVQHGYWHDGGSAVIKWDNLDDIFQPQVQFTCTNSSGNNIGVSNSLQDRWNRVQIIRQRAPEGSSDKSLNHTRVRFYVNETLYNECNGTRSGFGLEQWSGIGGVPRTFWDISHGNDGAGKLRIDNFKFYQNFGWNTSDVTLYGQVQVKNIAPNATNVSITPTSPVDTDDLKGHFNCTDSDGDCPNGAPRGNETRWYKNGVENESLRNFIVIGAGNTTPGENWIFSARVNDSFDWSEWANSSSIQITDTVFPQWTNNTTNSNSSFPKYGEVIQLNVTLSDNVALKNFTLTVDQNGVINNTNRTISGTSYVMSENITVTSPQGTTNKWNVTFYDSIGNVNATDTFTFVTVNSSPQWSNNKTNATASSPKFSDVIQLNVTITSNVNLKNYSLTLEQGANITTVNRSISGSTYNIIENFTITSQQGTTNKWNVTFYDLGDGRNSTDTFTFVTASSSPQWSNNITNANLSFPKKGETVQVNVTITNNVQFTNYSFTFDQGGNATILNRTISGISWIVIENFTISANQGTTNRWNITFRDVGGGSNSTDTFVLYTRNTLPTVTSFNITNDTTVNFNNKTYYITGNGTFSDADSNNSLLDREIRWLNGTTVIPNENGFSLNCAQYSNTNCAVGQNITAQMRVSDNSKEISNLSDWNASTFIIIDTVYPISFANLTAGNVSDNEGDGNIEINWTDDAVQINETYRLYRHTSIINSSSISSAALIGSNIREGTQFFKDNSTTNGTTYWYALVTVNQDGFFNESVSSLSFNATPNDTIAPKIPAGFNVTGSSDTATLSWANVTQDVRNNPDNFGLQYVIYYGTTFNSSKELANESITSPSTKTVSSNSTTIAVSSSGTYHFVVTTLDDGANKNLTLTLTQNYGNASLTISSSSGSSGGSGGGGGGGGGASGGGGGGAGAPDTTSSSHFYQTVAKNTETILKIPTSKTISVFKIIFTPLNDLSSVTFDVKEHTESTTPVSISGNVYQYIEIKLNGIKSGDVSGALLQFKVSKSWINLGNYDPSKVVLNRYVATWTPLQTTKTDEDLDYIYYNAQSPGFSVFAVTAEKKPVQKPENISISEEPPKIEEEIKQEPTLEQPLAAEGKPKEICGNNACKGFEWVICPKDCYHFKLSVPSKFKIHWTLVVIGTISLFILFVIGDQALQYARKPKERKKSKTAEEEKKEALTETLRRERIRKQFDEIKKLRELIKQERNNQKEISSEIKFIDKQSMIIKPARIKPVKVEKTKAIKSVPSETISIFSKLFPSRPKEEIVAEKKTKLFNRFRLENGKVLLVRDKNDKTSFGIFKEVTSVLHGLAVVRVNPSTLGYTRDGVKFIWLSESEGDNCINPSDIEDLYNEIKEFVKKQKEGIVLLQGLDYIISGTNFKTLLRILRMLKDEISSRNNLIIVSFNQDLLNKEEAEKLKSEFNII